jgi:hypothetical protein
MTLKYWIDQNQPPKGTLFRSKTISSSLQANRQLNKGLRAAMVAAWKFCGSRAASQIREQQVAKKSKKTAKTKKPVRREYTKADVKELRAHSKARTPVAKIAKLTRRTEGSLRQKALKLGIKLGHRR